MWAELCRSLFPYRCDPSLIKQQVPPLSCPVAACFCSLSGQPLPLCYQLNKASKGTGDFSDCHC